MDYAHAGWQRRGEKTKPGMLRKGLWQRLRKPKPEKKLIQKMCWSSRHLLSLTHLNELLFCLLCTTLCLLSVAVCRSEFVRSQHTCSKCVFSISLPFRTA